MPQCFLPVFDSLPDAMAAPAAKRPRVGGQRQRIAAANAAEANPDVSGESHLARYLVEMFAWGDFSPQRVQYIAQLAMADLLAFQENKDVKNDLVVLSKLGGGGSYPNKMHGELMAKTRNTSKIPEPMTCKIKFKEPLGVQTSCVLLPHELFSTLFHQYKDTWKKTILPPGDYLRRFWHRAEEHPVMSGHAIKHVPQWQDVTVPIGVHGDAVPVVGAGKAWVKTLDAFSWFSLVGHGSTKEKMHFTFSAFEKVCILGFPNGTYQEVFEILRWSLSWMQEGLWPDRDRKGTFWAEGTWQASKALQPLAKGYRGLLFALCGDLDYFASLLCTPHYNTKKGPCALCRCDEDGYLTWCNYRTDAPWIISQWTKEDWFAWPQRSSCPIFSIQGGSCHYIAYDYMHCKYLGSDQYQFGSVLKVLTHYQMAQSPEQNLRQLWKDIQDYYRLHQVGARFRYLTKVSMYVRATGAPKLRGKAAEIKHFIEPLIHVWEKYRNPALLLRQQVSLMLRLNLRMETILEENKDQLSFDDVTFSEFRDVAFGMFAVQSQVARHFMEGDDDKNLFSLTSKSHMLLHSVLRSKFLSPRLVWAFQGEDMMQKVQALAKNCVRGNDAAQATIKTARRYRLGLHFVFEEHKKAP